VAVTETGYRWRALTSGGSGSRRQPAHVREQSLVGWTVARNTNDRSHLRRRAASTGKPSWRAVAFAATGGSSQRPDVTRLGSPRCHRSHRGVLGRGL